jgi:chorismate lyase/3-hydroxybenzoate synthase
MTATQAGSLLEPSVRPATACAESGGATARGSGGVPARAASVPFFALRFGHGEAPGGDAAVVPVPLRHLGGESSWRIWDGADAVRADGIAGVGTLISPDHVVLHKSVPLADGADISAAALEVYREMLTRVRDLGYPHLVRIWNFVPDINRGAGDAETYVLFNHGRKAAFDLLGFVPSRYPAATGVGGPAGSPLTVVLAASRAEPIAVENPRQTSAYRYPRRYGPRSPAFARATLLPDRDGATLFISGTASIVGHESRHRGIEPQLAETLTNIAQLLECATSKVPGLRPGARRHWQVYLRDLADLTTVERGVRARLGGGDSVAFLQADICRRELLVEIEGVCELARSAPAPGA